MWPGDDHKREHHRNKTKSLTLLPLYLFVIVGEFGEGEQHQNKTKSLALPSLYLLVIAGESDASGRPQKGAIQKIRQSVSRYYLFNYL
jgi:hypothetical protein